MRRRWWERPWVIFWVAFGLRVAVILIGHTYRVRTDQGNFNFGFEAGRIARSLAWGQGYANPFNGESGATAWLPPLYPLLMAAAFKMFGVYSRGAAFFLLVCNSAFSAAIGPAVYEVGARCFDSYGIARRSAKVAQPVAVWSAWVWAVHPAAMQYAIHWIWEMSLSTCLFAWAMVLALRLRRVGENLQQGIAAGSNDDPRIATKLGTWVGFGVLWGLVALANASLLLCLPVMMIWILWPVKKDVRAIGGAVVACLVFAVVLAPWVVRNERVMGAFVPTRSNLGVELYESTLDRNDGYPWGTTLPLWTGDPEFQMYLKMGEVEYSKMRGEEAKARMRAAPGKIVHWTVQRFFFFWDGTPHPMDKHPGAEVLRQLSYSFISLCGLLGVGLAVKRRVPGAWLMAIAFVLLPLPYYLVTVQPRFRHPLEPLIAVLGVYLFRATGAKTNAEDAEEKRGGRGGEAVVVGV